MTAWTDFVTKIYKEGVAKNSSYKYKQAMVDASKRKSEMGSSGSSKGTRKSKRKGKGGMKSCGCMKKCKCSKKGKTRKRRRH
jgi:hypothetical protein